jgi:3-isopropylmalate/(R)-2-methylmalate dehydratase small subunit
MSPVQSAGGGRSRSFVSHTGIAVPFLRPNVDTDLITPLNRPEARARLSTAEFIFESIRYHPDGSENPDFILNQEPYRRASILLAGPNFGTGSSRESAVTGLVAFGFRAVLAPSFGEIFYNNCFANGLLPVTLGADVIGRFARQVEAAPEVEMTVDLERNVVERSGVGTVAFSIDPRLRNKILNGLNDLDEILLHTEVATAFRQADRGRRPWIYDWQ